MGYTCKVLRIVTGAQKVVHQSNKGNNDAAAGGGGDSDNLLSAYCMMLTFT